MGDWRRTSVSAFAVLALVTGVASSAGAVGRADEATTGPTRIMLVGDSVTQGSAGDFTWRYRLWTQLRSEGLDVDFVGPRSDLFDNVTKKHGSDAYADPDFDRDHAARWGASIAVPDVDIGTLVATYEPDVVIEMLGVNDLTWGDRSPEDVVADVSQFVADARAVDPALEFVLAHQVQTWAENVPEFNELLDSAASAMSTANSPVVVSRPDIGFEEVADTWDHAHPNAQGELVIAAAQADALAELGIGSTYPRPLPSLPLGPRTPAVLEAWSQDEAVALAWVGPPGADGEYVWIRDVTPGAGWGWVRTSLALPGNGWVYSGLVNGHTYEFRLEAAKGFQSANDVSSNVVAVVPRADPPTIALATAGADGRATLVWAGAPGDEYVVERADPRAPDAWAEVLRTPGTSTVLEAVPPGQTDLYRVLAVTEGVLSRPSTAVSVTAPLARPARLVRAVSPRRNRVRATWNLVPEATSYQVFTAVSPSCRRRTHVFRERVADVDGRVVFRTAKRAMWVRVRSVRMGVPGPLVHSSTACTLVR